LVENFPLFPSIFSENSEEESSEDRETAQTKISFLPTIGTKREEIRGKRSPFSEIGGKIIRFLWKHFISTLKKITKEINRKISMKVHKISN
jgi:hypothetical protein